MGNTIKLVNRPFDTLKPGDFSELSRLVTADDLYAFAAASGNFNPMHLDGIEFSGLDRAEHVAPGIYVASLISAAIGMNLPGPGTLYQNQTVQFHTRAHIGDTLIARVEVLEKGPQHNVRLATTVRRASDDVLILSGEATVLAPSHAFERDHVEIPGLIVQRHRHFERLLDQVRDLPPLPTAVVCPEEPKSLEGALAAAEQTLIAPILIGRKNAIAEAAQKIAADLSGFEMIDTATPQEASAFACKLVRDGRVAAVMKGHLHTDDLLKPMLDKAHGLRVGRRFTHIFVMDVPGQPEPILVSDAAINIAPDLATKVDICQNAIDVARALGMEARVGVLSAVETVTPAIQSSIDAALLSKMAERGQIKGGVVEGPLAMDNAIDIGAARTKGLEGVVAGHANILVVPDLDAGNMVAKQLAYISHAEGAGLVLGAKVPVILNSRSDSVMSRLASCAVAVLFDAQKAPK